jgi:hypothetical protein
MKTKITKREVYAFLLGAVIIIVIQFFADFKNNVNSFKEGFNKGYKNDRQEDTR